MPDTPCELCGDLMPGHALYEDPDRGWDALCAACFRLQQPPEPRPLPYAGLGRPRPRPGRKAREEEAW